MGMFKAVLFDFDGVIARTMEDNFAAWVHALGKYEVRIGKEEYFLLEGAPPAKVAEIFAEKAGLDPRIAPDVVHAKEQFYRENNKFEFYPGIHELISELKHGGYRLGVVSGAFRGRLLSTGLGAFLGQFDVVITADDITKGKPDPEPFLQAAAKLGLVPGECMVVENAPLGIEAARAASMFCVAVCSTLDHKHLARANLIIENIGDLRSHLGAPAGK